MHPSILPLLLTLFTLTTAFPNTTREFHLSTRLLPNQPANKSSFDHLYLIPYHTGAGFNDVVLSPTLDPSVRAFFNGSKGARPHHNLLFNLGNDFPWFMDMEAYTNFYAAWEPVGINVEFQKPGGFFLNGTRLQWTSNPSDSIDQGTNIFAGWLVCDWWHGAPQLFFRIAGYSIADYPAPSSCADVHLHAEFI
ncbi:hypothetical protein BDY17DRAFT_320656 [Neohortaea acidophila]|uniref:DUF7907 domain-containing protein n=1 Tax=Neohortaea acidophila TaxID=245834 RepID=A0A6A6Q9R5_9PEZI|nr:uncharacterized protein BDY17DRAFT_320656 [Neohortaea acidophila]KAF2488157.1 hypothetical protein BDY17DRAFT_320656 [Neohortaea acidophila]